MNNSQSNFRKYFINDLCKFNFFIELYDCTYVNFEKTMREKINLDKIYCTDRTCNDDSVILYDIFTYIRNKIALKHYNTFEEFQIVKNNTREEDLRKVFNLYTDQDLDEDLDAYLAIRKKLIFNDQHINVFHNNVDNLINTINQILDHTPSNEFIKICQENRDKFLSNCFSYILYGEHATAEDIMTADYIKKLDIQFQKMLVGSDSAINYLRNQEGLSTDEIIDCLCPRSRFNK